MRILAIIFFVAISFNSFAQSSDQSQTKSSGEFTNRILIPATAVKNQAMTGTCWCFSTTSLIESQCLKSAKLELDLSEMFTVRNIYIEKARNYILRQGKAQFGEGGLGHDLIRSIETYGAEPESAYSGLINGQRSFNHQALIGKLKMYLDNVLKTRPILSDWVQGYTKILDEQMGAAPSEFDYKGKKYTAKSFAKDVMNFKADDYVSISSFTHHPFYKTFVLEAPDNFADASFYNIPLEEMISIVNTAVKNGYSVMWDADVSNSGFRQDKGLALYFDPKKSKEDINADVTEQPWNQAKRQTLYEDLTTQDDHLMHITGIEKSKSGKNFFVVKNSWGTVGPYDGYIHVSEAYFAINTVSLVVPKAALSKDLLTKLQIK